MIFGIFCGDITSEGDITFFILSYQSAVEITRNLNVICFSQAEILPLGTFRIHVKTCCTIIILEVMILRGVNTSTPTYCRLCVYRPTSAAVLTVNNRRFQFFFSCGRVRVKPNSLPRVAGQNYYSLYVVKLFTTRLELVRFSPKLLTVGACRPPTQPATRPASTIATCMS